MLCSTNNWMIVSIAGIWLGLGSIAALSASLDMLGVEVANTSQPQLCAEKDNVTLTFTNEKVKQFRIEAAHPNYIHTLQRDSWAADWTACDIPPSAPAGVSTKPTKVTIYEDVELWVTGYVFPSFWRDAKVPFRVGDRVETGLHLIQVWMRFNDRAEEVLVVYPADGYWRARPLPPQHLGWSAYGSSFMIGPVEDQGRPIVDLKQILFDPEKKAFSLEFARGGTATVVIGKLDRDKLRLDITFGQPIAGRPFAALRSMYVTGYNNDVAEVSVLEKGAQGWREEKIMSFAGAKSATDIWAGRLVPSRHNTSSPDMVFSSFSDGTQQPREWRDPTKPQPAPALSPTQK